MSNLAGTRTKDRVRDLLDKHYEEKVSVPMNARLDEVELYIRNELKKVADQNKAIQGFLMQEVKFTIANQLYNAEITMAAWERVLLAEGLKIENLKEKVDEAKKAIDADNRVKGEQMIKDRAEGHKEEPKA